jgi:hypothetical protein
VPKQKIPAPKKWYKSRLFWFNAASGGIAALVGVIQLLEGKITPSYYLVTIGLINAVNVGLRFITTSPIYTKQLDKEYVETLEKTDKPNP